MNQIKGLQALEDLRADLPPGRAGNVEKRTSSKEGRPSLAVEVATTNVMIALVDFWSAAHAHVNKGGKLHHRMVKSYKKVCEAIERTIEEGT